MWVSFRVTRTGEALNSFLSTVTVETVPGLAWISMVPEIGNDTPGSADATTPLSGGGPSSPGSAEAIGAAPSGISEQAASAAKRFTIVFFRFEFDWGSNGLGDAEVRDDVIGVIGRARQRGVRAD